MFGFSLAEFILVIIVAIIFIKPQDLPELARMLGKIVAEIKMKVVIFRKGPLPPLPPLPLKTSEPLPASIFIFVKLPINPR